MSNNDPYGAATRGGSSPGARPNPMLDALNYGAHWLTGNDPGWNRRSKPAPRNAPRSASVEDLRAEQNLAIQNAGGGYGRRSAPPAPPPPPGGQRQAPPAPTMRPLTGGATAPARQPARVAPAASAPAPAQTLAAAAPESAPATAYQPVADLGAARRAAFMGAGDTAQGMNEVRKLLAAEAGIADADRNKYKVAELERRAIERRSGKDNNWASGINNEQVQAAFKGQPAVDVNAFTNPAMAGMAEKAGVNFDSKTFGNADWSQVSGDKAFGWDYAVPAGGSPLTRDVAPASPMTPEATGQWMSNYTNKLLQDQVSRREYRLPVQMGTQPIVHGNSANAINPSAMIEAFANAGEKPPLSAGTAEALAAGAAGVLGGGRKGRLGSSRLGYFPAQNLPPLAIDPWRPAIAGSPR